MSACFFRHWFHTSTPCLRISRCSWLAIQFHSYAACPMHFFILPIIYPVYSEGVNAFWQDAGTLLLMAGTARRDILDAGRYLPHFRVYRFVQSGVRALLKVDLHTLRVSLPLVPSYTQYVSLPLLALPQHPGQFCVS